MEFQVDVENGADKCAVNVQNVKHIFEEDSIR